MVAWLEIEEPEDAKVNTKVWGVTQMEYGFLDLIKWLANGGTLKMAKGKAKEIDETRSHKKSGGGSSIFWFYLLSICLWTMRTPVALCILTLIFMVPGVNAASMQDSFPDVTFKAFNQFVNANFDTKVSLATVLMFAQCAKEDDTITSLALKLDILAEVLDLSPYDSQGVFQTKLHPVSYDAIQSYLKIGREIWVDCVFSNAVIGGMYSFHASAAAYTDFWNDAYGNANSTNEIKITYRHIWQAFIQESTRSVAFESKLHLELDDNIPINEVTTQAFSILGENPAAVVGVDENGIVPSLVVQDPALDDSFDNIEPNASANHQTDNANADYAPVKMVVLDGIVMEPTHCAYDDCTNDLGNARGGLRRFLQLRHAKLIRKSGLSIHKIIVARTWLVFKECYRDLVRICHGNQLPEAMLSHMMRNQQSVRESITLVLLNSIVLRPFAHLVV
ncbi:hypothetical protein BD779DRAFT_1468376 [Infundibulicybe gibba]|nr:hypothetical protein BD779DRAFT_1468376 [Infundibulicybe gibba]